MPVVKRLMNVGGSRGIVLPKPFLDQLAVAEDGELEVALERDRIVLTAHRYATDAEFQASADRVVTKRRGLIKRLAKR
jgi:antitoxin component of MazEF toxin-antitoxin module